MHWCVIRQRVLQQLPMYVKLWKACRNDGYDYSRRHAMPSHDDARKDAGPNPNTGFTQTPTTLAQMQLAGLATGSALLGQWLMCTIMYSEQVSKIFGTAGQDQGSYQKAAIDVLDVYQKYLQQTLNLSSTFGLRFYSELDNLRRRTASESTAKR
jgi:hypothetical protein